MLVSGYTGVLQAVRSLHLTAIHIFFKLLLHAQKIWREKFEILNLAEKNYFGTTVHIVKIISNLLPNSIDVCKPKKFPKPTQFHENPLNTLQQKKKSAK